ncbi:hypothetical protein pb186bvf_015199 [Paramecium bursaria]
MDFIISKSLQNSKYSSLIIFSVIINYVQFRETQK